MPSHDDSRAHRIDWDDIKRRLPTSVGFEETPEDLERVFQARADELARTAAVSATAASAPHLHFHTGEVRFAIALQEIRTILKPSLIARIPLAPEHLAHVLHADGRIVALVDLAAMMEVGQRDKTGARTSHVIVLGTSGSPLGVLVDRIEGLRLIDAVDVSTSVRAGRGTEFLRGITPDMTLVIDTHALIESIRNMASTPQI